MEAGKKLHSRGAFMENMLLPSSKSFGFGISTGRETRFPQRSLLAAQGRARCGFRNSSGP